jgi:hypothetical protein
VETELVEFILWKGYLRLYFSLRRGQEHCHNGWPWYRRFINTHIAGHTTILAHMLCSQEIIDSYPSRISVQICFVFSRSTFNSVHFMTNFRVTWMMLASEGNHRKKFDYT